MKLNKIALAVAVASGAMAVHTAAQADSVFFPYVVYGGAVTTVINVIDTVPSYAADYSYYTPTGAVGGNRLHYTLVSKQGQNALSNTEPCNDVDLYLPSSPFDLQTIDLGGYFTAEEDKGVMFDDPSINNQWQQALGTSPLTYALAELAGGGTAAVRGYLVVDNANDYYDGNTVAGEAFIFDYVDGAAWGYRGFAQNGEGSSQGEFNYSYSAMLPGTAVSFMPLDETTTRFFVTPLPISAWIYGQGGNHPSASPSYNQFVTRVGFQNGVVYDRDEGLHSGTRDQIVRCVGAVDVSTATNGLLDDGLATLVANGGWARLRTTWADPASEAAVEEICAAPEDGENGDGCSIDSEAEYNQLIAFRDTPLAHVIKLEFTALGVFNGQPAPGVYNNAFELGLLNLPDLWPSELTKLRVTAKAKTQ